MKTITKLRLLFILMLLIALGSAGAAVWSARQAAFHIERMSLAHEVYEAHLALSSHTYQLFKQYGDALIIGDRDKGKGEAELTGKIRADIDRIRGLIGAEIDLVGTEEVEELETVSEIEKTLENLIETLDRVSEPTTFDDQFSSNWGELSRILDDDIDRDFHSLVEEMLAEEQEEVDETREIVDRELTFHRTLIVILVATAVLTLMVCLWLLQQLISRPVDRLLTGIRRFSDGDLDKPIALEGRDEFAEISRTLDLMAKRLSERTEGLASQNAELEQAVAERTERLERLLDDMKRADAGRRRMLADVSHELRTPLTIIRGEAEIALRGKEKSADTYREALIKAREAADHTSHLVDDLLFIARKESGHARLRIDDLDLKPLLGDLALHAGITTVLTTDLDKAPMRGDADRLRQAVLILLENARQYGGNHITLRLDHSPAGYRIAVEDDGPGMSDAEKESAFERFFRGSNAAERYADGVGLGLPVARSIIEAHGGSTALEDRPGGGLLAIISLPRQRPLKAVS